MKSTLIAILGCFILGQNINPIKAANVTWGDYVRNEELLHFEVVSKKGIPNDYVSGNLFWNQKDPNPKTITYIVVTDVYLDGNGGYATLSAGGPRFTFVKIYFGSIKSHGYHFLVEIYGR